MFGHGTRVWPAICLYCVMFVIGFYSFGQSEALVFLPAQRIAKESSPQSKILADGGELDTDRRIVSQSFGASLRAAFPPATFALGSEFTYSNRPVRLLQNTEWPEVSYCLAWPGTFEESRASATPSPGPRRGAGITYAELAAIMTLTGWLLIPIFILRLVAQMRRIDARDLGT